MQNTATRFTRSLLLATVLLAVLIACLPIYASAQTSAVVNTTLSVYATAHLGSPVIAQLPVGTNVQVLSFDANWAEIAMGPSEQGYVVTSYLTIGSVSPSFLPAPYPTPTAAPAHEKLLTENANATVATPNHGPIHLRKAPDYSAGLVGTYANGSRVRLISQEGDWYYLQAGSHTGYMAGEFIQADGTLDLTGDSTKIDAVVKNPTDGEVLHLRAQPTTDSDILGEYHNGTYVEILRPGTQWHMVLVDGKQGYMMSEFVEITTPDASAEMTIDAQGASAVNLYREPSTQAVVETTLVDGTLVTAVIPYADWTQVQVTVGSESKTGYVSNANLQNATGIVTDMILDAEG